MNTKNEIVTENQKFYVLSMRRGVGIKIGPDPVRLAKIVEAFEAKDIIKIDGQFINSVDVDGIIEEKIYEENEKRKQGYWKCALGNWHERGKKCNPRQCFLDNHVEYQELMKRLKWHQKQGCDIPEEEWTVKNRTWHICAKAKMNDQLRLQILEEAEEYENIEFNY